ncbi:ATP-binding protein [Streptomyces sp. TS71-3]|uniref:ATP-binding protein n=1 Tax=Streptomyces sp. TS71-3 TaxID=2733862 RepID=UPI001B1411BE|nr:ATP-binding protein [Streptomyces sp. TS71-3]GHJ40383.1 ATP-binding protein [Streptomyces sp. TS71-3]
MSEHSARHLRRILRAYLLAWEMPEVIDAGTLAMTELVANVVRHVPGRRCSLRILREPKGLRVEVADDAPGLPRIPPAACPAEQGSGPGELAEDGRGLLLLAGVVDRWGVVPEKGEPGKSVWFECDAGGG